MNTQSRYGGCACGNTRYELLRSPLFVHCCHCHWCQTESGASFALNALIESHELVLTAGRTEAIKTPSASGQGQVIVRCVACRIALWSHYSALGDSLAFLRVGSLDDPSQYPPDIHIYTAYRQTWLDTGFDVPVVPEYYRRSKYWSADSLERYRLLKLRTAVSSGL